MYRLSGQRTLRGMLPQLSVQTRITAIRGSTGIRRCRYLLKNVDIYFVFVRFN